MCNWLSEFSKWSQFQNGRHFKIAAAQNLKKPNNAQISMKFGFQEDIGVASSFPVS